jgi:hypothetical protein
MHTWRRYVLNDEMVVHVEGDWPAPGALSGGATGVLLELLLLDIICVD